MILKRLFYKYNIFYLISFTLIAACAPQKKNENNIIYVAYSDSKNQTQIVETTFKVENSDIIVFDDIIIGNETSVRAGNIVYLNNIHNQNLPTPKYHMTLSSLKPKSSALWPKAIIPYEINETFFGETIEWLEHQIFLFNKIMADNKVNLRLVPRTDQKAFAIFRYFPFTNGHSSCGSSWVGYRGVPSNINLTCLKTRTFQHEVLHLLGLAHEHQRPDRDDYVVINASKDNINYKRYPILQSYLPGPYDLDSVMHYHFNNIVKLKKGVKDTGDRTSLSEGDIAALADIYGSTAL